MKIIYQQGMPSGVLLDHLGIQNCYFKHLFTERDTKSITTKIHYHTGYEIHIVEGGHLIYETGLTQQILSCGQFLLLPPSTPHRVVYRSQETSTVSLCFHMVKDNHVLPEITNSILGEISPRMQTVILHMLAEYRAPQALTPQLMSIGIGEILVLLWRLCGMKDESHTQEKHGEDSRLILAKQYVVDNIEIAPTVADVSAYCHLSTKQLGRLFMQAEGITPAMYIQKQRIKRIEMLLRAGSLSLQEISERMRFSSEYYFNSYFKKHAGMTPGEFRSMYTSK